MRPDDIVRVNKRGRIFEAFVTGKPTNGQVSIQPICRGITYTVATAREVSCHWSKRGRRRNQAA